MKTGMRIGARLSSRFSVIKPFDFIISFAVLTLKRHKCRAPIALALAALPLFAAGCEHVKPWQRGTLADYTMRGDRDPLGVAQDEHIFFSREAVAGGRGVGGGGCGCN